MASQHTTQVHARREHNFADKMNDRRAAVVSRLMRRAVARVSPKRQWLEAATVEPSEVA